MSLQSAVSARCSLNPATTAGTAHVSLAEFNSRDGAATPDAIKGNIQPVMQQLEVLRAEVGGAAITIVSGYRSPAHNTAVSGAARSQHLCGMAADIRLANHTPAQVHAIIERLIAAGQMTEGGLGLYGTVVHYETRGTRARWPDPTSAARRQVGDQASPAKQTRPPALAGGRDDENVEGSDAHRPPDDPAIRR